MPLKAALEEVSSCASVIPIYNSNVHIYICIYSGFRLPAYNVRRGRAFLLANEVGIALLLIVQSLEVLLDDQIDRRRWRVCQKVLKVLGIHGEVSLQCCKPVEGRWWHEVPGGDSTGCRPAEGKAGSAGC